MDMFGNPIPGSSKEFDSDFQWLETEFIANDENKDVFVCSPTNNDIILNNDQNIKVDQIKPSPTHNIEDFFDEIQSIDFSQNQDSGQNNTILLELLERCENLIDIVSRNLIDLDEIIVGIDENIACSVRNATKANDAIEYEKKSIMKIPIKKLKNKAYLANYFKIGLSNCPKNPHLAGLYDDNRLILSYNGRFILEECVERNLWNQDFKNKLEQAIHTEVLEKLKMPLCRQHVRLGVDLEFEDDPEIKTKIELEKKDIENELDILSKTPFRHLVFQFMDSQTEYDWLQIGKITNKPYLQCKRFWHLMLKPHISRANWTQSENNQLIEITKKYNEKNWQQIAVELNTNRNELQCFVHYQHFRKSSYKTGKWSMEEDNKLMRIVKAHTIDNIIYWQKVNFAMLNEGRSVEQIYNRWVSSLKPGIKKGPLTHNEKVLINTAQLKKVPPYVVSLNLTNRTTTQIRNAYHRNALSKNIVRGGWTPEEDKMLLRAVHPHARNELTWSQIAKEVPGRNAEQCRHRYTLIEKKVQKDPQITVDNFQRTKRPYHVTREWADLDEKQLQESFKQNRLSIKRLIKVKEVETAADRKLKKSYLDNIYITTHCNFSSKCELLKYLLDYMGADLVVPEQFNHEDDLKDEGLLSMMTYLKECSIKPLTLNSCNIEQNMTDDVKSTYDGIHGVLRTSDIINSDISEIEGLLDIRIRNHHDKSTSQSINNKNSASIQKCNLVKPSYLLPLYYMGSVPPNYETFKMLYSYITNLNTLMKTNSLKTHNIKFDWDAKESKKLHQRLVAIFRWPALFSGLVNYNTENINIISNIKQQIDSNYSAYPYVCAKKRKLHFNSKTF